MEVSHEVTAAAVSSSCLESSTRFLLSRACFVRRSSFFIRRSSFNFCSAFVNGLLNAVFNFRQWLLVRFPMMPLDCLRSCILRANSFRVSSSGNATRTRVRRFGGRDLRISVLIRRIITVDIINACNSLRFFPPRRDWGAEEEVAAFLPMRSSLVVGSRFRPLVLQYRRIKCSSSCHQPSLASPNTWSCGNRSRGRASAGVPLNKIHLGAVFSSGRMERHRSVDLFLSMWDSSTMIHRNWEGVMICCFTNSGINPYEQITTRDLGGMTCLEDASTQISEGVNNFMGSWEVRAWDSRCPGMKIFAARFRFRLSILALMLESFPSHMSISASQ
mmetsp:Transcript_35383/g.40967  ORF Transcript_35383/g.40967 Transcript_35383/m.40967 type:complete len:331 (-) Transcript_35383:1358-2350(-)